MTFHFCLSQLSVPLSVSHTMRLHVEKPVVIQPHSHKALSMTHTHTHTHTQHTSCTNYSWEPDPHTHVRVWFPRLHTTTHITHTHTHFRACKISKFPGGLPPDPPHNPFCGAPLFVFALGPANPLGGPVCVCVCVCCVSGCV